MYHATQIESLHNRPIDGILVEPAGESGRPVEAMTIPCGPGSVLFYQGDDAEHFFEVLQGVVKLYMLTPDGRRQVTNFCFPGQFVGHGSEALYPQTAEAVGSVVVRRYSRSSMERLLAEQPALAHRLLQTTLDELVVAQDQMLSLGRKTAIERIASFFVRLSRRNRKADQAASLLHLPMARTDIADYLGLTPETVSRVFSRLKGLGVIALKSVNDIEIRDLDLLAELADDETALVFN